jgi:hypothetical protein
MTTTERADDMSETSDTKETKWIPALVIGGETTPKQRQRNFALYQRLREGDGSGEYRASGLSGLTFEVPAGHCVHAGGNPPRFSFRLDKESDCFNRLLHVIADHFDTKCDADDEVERLRAGLDLLYENLRRFGATGHGKFGGEIERQLNIINSLLGRPRDA